MIVVSFDAMVSSCCCCQRKQASRSVVVIIHQSFQVTNVSAVQDVIRPHLEYATVVWGPSCKGNQMPLERIQRRASKLKLVLAIRSLPSHECIRELGLPLLSLRRMFRDMMTVNQSMVAGETIKAF